MEVGDVVEVGNYWSGIGFGEVDVVEGGNFRTFMFLTSPKKVPTVMPVMPVMPVMQRKETG